MGSGIDGGRCLSSSGMPGAGRLRHGWLSVRRDQKGSLGGGILATYGSMVNDRHQAVYSGGCGKVGRLLIAFATRTRCPFSGWKLDTRCRMLANLVLPARRTPTMPMTANPKSSNARKNAPMPKAPIVVPVHRLHSYAGHKRGGGSRNRLVGLVGHGEVGCPGDTNGRYKGLQSRQLHIPIPDSIQALQSGTATARCGSSVSALPAIV